MFKNLRFNFIAFTIGVLLSFSTAAMASYAISSNKYFGPYAGYSYFNYSDVDVTSNYGAIGGGSTCTQSGQAPAGYMGAEAYLYNKSGTLIMHSDVVYNSTSSGGIGNGTNGYKVSGYYYYGMGRSEVYNGNDYTEVYSNKSPYLYY